MKIWRHLADFLTAHGAAAMISVHDVKGSAPREAGARMAVRPDGAFHGTIGGGQLEMKMLAIAGEMFGQRQFEARMVDQALGPDLGQCCGGRVKILIETFDTHDLAQVKRFAAAEDKGIFVLECRLDHGRVRREFSSSVGDDTWTEWRETHGENRTPLLLFGAGHVGRALVLALAPLPFAVRWFDSRPEAFPLHIPQNASAIRLKDPEAEIAGAPADAFVLVMTHDHPLDLAITAAALKRDFPYVGLIGSASKRARFEKRFREIGIDRERIAALVCPIGVSGIADKDPAVIAASVTAQLLHMRERATSNLSPPIPPRDKSAP
ncbi:xanthine dehydrogenase accessory protein XdhC [Microvirga brassicacearum]|uniref:Xanthine dehydrogenase accessory protein XdhC n=1 Tax=Microvirga brassicacearum TaxID=2580413 RepID=A0A5N3P523_9HYPH|nr:xanthine dehydrogenase accessory protein XdhC [Microvirga brassicacearum]KAB0264803.1 xanthine dehydrogenase accessory protein XdhC [Microvirga brassicacearum]